MKVTITQRYEGTRHVTIEVADEATIPSVKRQAHKIPDAQWQVSEHRVVDCEVALAAHP